MFLSKLIEYPGSGSGPGSGSKLDQNPRYGSKLDQNPGSGSKLVQNTGSGSKFNVFGSTTLHIKEDSDQNSKWS